MKRRAFALCACLLLLGLVPGSTLAVSGVRDQSNPSTDNNPACSNTAPDYPLAQTFTAGKSGSLTEVDLWMTGDGTTSITVKIEGTTSGGAPNDADVLATATATPASTAGWVEFIFSTPPSITSETAYAIVFSTGRIFAVCAADSYAGALAWNDDGSWSSGGEMAFQTFVAGAAATPTPCATPASTPTPTVEAPQLVIGTGSSPAQAIPAATICTTPPPTGTSGGGSRNDSTPLPALLICLAFAGLSLAAVEVRQRNIRS
jgi:Domain of unknown function (DUF4082)